MLDFCNISNDLDDYMIMIHWSKYMTLEHLNTPNYSQLNGKKREYYATDCIGVFKADEVS